MSAQNPVMPSLSAGCLLVAWERGLDQNPVERTLELLAAGDPSISRDTWARVPAGKLDEQLLLLREAIFGPDMALLANCPACRELLETKLFIPDIRVPGNPDLPFSIQIWDYQVRFRLPDSCDLMLICDEPDSARAEKILVERCILEVIQDGLDKTHETLPAEVMNDIMKRMDEADPLSDIQLTLTCPACKHTWQEQFEIFPLLWSEIDTWARHTLGEIHTLASAYGWSESDILAMSAIRRQLYLEMVVK